MQNNVSENILVQKYGTVPETGRSAYYDRNDLSDKKQENYPNYQYFFEKLRETHGKFAYFTEPCLFDKYSDCDNAVRPDILRERHPEAS